MLLFLLATSANADAPAEANAPVAADDAVGADAPQPITMTVSGGASLGSYEAGYLYYLMRQLETDPDGPRIRIAAGASAGAVNALLTLVEQCTGTHGPVEASLHWQTWSNLRIADMVDPEGITARNALSRGPFEEAATYLRERMQRGLPESCDFLLAVPVTRVYPHGVDLREELADLPRTQENFAIRVRGRGPGRMPEFSNYVDLEHGVPTVRLPLDGDEEGEFEHVLRLLYASTAIPLVFRPVALANCIHDSDETDPGPCTVTTARVDEFVDGGVFDNEPLDLAVRLAANALDENHRIRDEPEIEDVSISDEGALYVVGSDHAAYPPTCDGDQSVETEPSSALDFGLDLVDTFVSSARVNELRTILESRPALRHRANLSRNHLPPLSEHLHGLFGFFDRALMRFDFVLGMYDAAYQLASNDVHAPGAGTPGTPGTPFQRHLSGEGEVWRQFSCMRAVLERDEDAGRACEGLEARHFLSALQTSIDRLYATCAELPQHRLLSMAHPLCHDARAGRPIPRVPGLGETDRADEWRRDSDESQLHHTIRRLIDHDHAFADFDADVRSSRDVLVQVRRRLGTMLRAFRRAQPAHGALLGSVGELALDEIHYVPPRHAFHVGLGGMLGIGWSVAAPYSRVPWLRFAVSFDAIGLTSLLASVENYTTFAFFVGTELELIPFSSPTVQYRVHAMAGYGLSSDDDWRRSPCANEEARGIHCSRALVSVGFSAKVLRVLRFDLHAIIGPSSRRATKRQFAIIPMIGVELNSYD